MDQDEETYGSEMDDSETKECRFCGEEIRKAAIKCRHCGEHLKQRPGGGDARIRKQIDDAATMALIMAIIGIVACPITLPIGIIKGNEAKRRAIAAGIAVPGGATAGIIIGWLFISLNVLAILAVVLLFVVAIVAAPR